MPKSIPLNLSYRSNNCNELNQTHKNMIIKSKTLRNLNKDVNSAEIVLSELVSYKKANKLSGFAVIYDENDTDLFKRKSTALLDGIYDLISWVKVHGGEIRLFTNALGNAAIKSQEDSGATGIHLETDPNNRKGREMLRKAKEMREGASLNRGYGNTRTAKVERLMIGRADALESKALALMSI